MAQVLPKELRLVAPATMPQARSYLFKQQSTNATYTEGQTIQINIPRLQRSYLTKDSYLKFSLGGSFTTGHTGGSGAGATQYWLLNAVPMFDSAGAQGLISKIEVYDYLGSTLLESISGHDALVTTLQDIQINGDQMGFHHNITEDTAGPLVSIDEQNVFDATPADVAGLTAYLKTANFKLFNVQRGGNVITSPFVQNNGDPGNVTYTYSKEVAFPLFSFLGHLSSKFVPLHNGFTINITLNPLNRAMSFSNFGTGAATGTFTTSAQTISDVNMCCQVLELGPVAESMLLSSTAGQPLVVPSKSFRNFIGTVAAGSSSFKIDLNLNVASLTNILFIQRQSTNFTTNPILKKTLSSRCRNYLSSWYFQYGSSILPQTSGVSCRGRLGQTEPAKAQGSTEAYNELLKSRHKFNVPTHGGCLSSQNYNIDVPTATQELLFYRNIAVRPTFACGLDLELVSGRSQEIVSGLNTNGMNTSLLMTFDKEGGNTPVETQLDVWCEYDSFINISPGIATTVSF